MPQIFSPRADIWLRQFALFVVLATAATVGATYYYASARFTRVGYQPDQPVSFSHKQHVGEIGLDCRYCHTQVEKSPHATIPGAGICMNCHSLIKTTILSRPINCRQWNGSAFIACPTMPISITRYM